MGYIRHHAIIATSYDEKKISQAQAKAMNIFNGVSLILKSEVNGYYSFFIPTDGSKEGWKESEIGDKKRESFLDWIDSQAYEDGSNSLSYVEVYYGDDEGLSGVVRAN